MDVEPAPDFLPQEDWQKYGYGIYSARYGNVYTVRQMYQLAQRAFGKFKPVDNIWEHKGGVVDPFRPTLEPEPFGSAEELEMCRRTHLESVADLLSSTGLLIFTLGLTESFVSSRDGAVFPVCPGVSGGKFSEDNYSFANFSYSDVVRDFNALKLLLHSNNRSIRFLLTVSPVPLVATATKKNVGVATTYSKSVLRAAAGALADGKSRVDYFPSYEIISMPANQGRYFDKNKRNVTAEGVSHVMENVMQSYKKSDGQGGIKVKNTAVDPISLQGLSKSDSVVCDEELLAQFGN